MRYHSYLNSATAIINAYKGDLPFSIFIKRYFSEHKKFGGRDRKQISALCYHYFRLGKAMPGIGIEDKIIAACFLCESQVNEFLEFHKPEWNVAITKPLVEKMQMLHLHLADVFPCRDELSAGIEFEPFAASFFTQPDLFLRIRPGKKDIVLAKMTDAGIGFELKGNDSIALPNATKLDGLVQIDEEVIIQDLNSQLVLNYLKQNTGIAGPVRIWDCCAASGGKSILACDALDGNCELTVSDIRESILSNLKERFHRAGIEKYKTFRADLANGLPDWRIQFPGPADNAPQVIICDAPCTGSGTWSRTPEQLGNFKPLAIEDYATLQRKIVSTSIPVLEAGGLFFYITCSVFKKENERVAEFIKEKFHLQLLQMELLKGYDKKADTMFVAAFKKG